MPTFLKQKMFHILVSIWYIKCMRCKKGIKCT